MNIFLSVPFSSHVDDAGSILPDYRSSVENVLDGLRQKSHIVFCAPEYAGWKLGGMSLPEEEFAHDLTEIDAADKLIVLLEERVSAGVQIETGYAFAKAKAIETYQIGSAAWSNIAFSRLNGHEIKPVQNINDFVAQVIAAN